MNPHTDSKANRPKLEIIPGGITKKITPYERMMAKVKRCAMAGDFDTAHKIVKKFTECMK